LLFCKLVGLYTNTIQHKLTTSTSNNSDVIIQLFALVISRIVLKNTEIVAIDPDPDPGVRHIAFNI